MTTHPLDPHIPEEHPVPIATLLAADERTEGATRSAAVSPAGEDTPNPNLPAAESGRSVASPLRVPLRSAVVLTACALAFAHGWWTGSRSDTHAKASPCGAPHCSLPASQM